MTTEETTLEEVVMSWWDSLPDKMQEEIRELNGEKK